jgi:hypothetical protein
MKTPFLFLAVVFFGCSLALDAQESAPPAQTFAPSAGQTFYLDLDTAEGAVSEWSHKDLGSLSALRATLRVPRLRKHDKWFPTFSVFLDNGETGQARNRVGLELWAPDRKPPLRVRLIQSVAGKLSEHSSNRTVDLGENLNVEMIWQTPHTITIKIGDSESHTVNIPWSVNGVSVSASTGQMEVDPLALGSIGR